MASYRAGFIHTFNKNEQSEAHICYLLAGLIVRVATLILGSRNTAQILLCHFPGLAVPC